MEVLFEDMKDKNFEILGRSGYRSFHTQRSIFNSNARKHGEEYANRFSAYPGQSEHQTGLAMDVTNSKVNFRLSDSFGKTEEGIWLKENAHNYGFIIRYPEEKEHITEYIYEPWHLRYLGEELAIFLYEHNITLEEFYDPDFIIDYD